jgi:Fic family protein
MTNRAGENKINLKGELEYMSFVPSPLPPNPPLQQDADLLNLLSRANRSLGILEGLSRRIPSIDLFVSMYVRKEALLSSQIEGTQATLDDILDPNLEGNANQNIVDVLNYIKASRFAIERMKELPICNRLLQEIHAVLLQDIRGGEKYPGEFRRSQNWIGPAGSTLKNARFIPPTAEDMMKAMSDLEIYINQTDDFDPLIRIALIHYQFETIHPFLDGNGRIGRLLIVLYLIERKLLSREVLYLSYYLKRNQIEYYDRLNEVRTKGNYEQWVKFFLLAVEESAQDAITAIEKLSQLHEKNLILVNQSRRLARTMLKVFIYLEASPIIDIKKTKTALGVSFNAVSHAVNGLVDLGILAQTTNSRRNRLFAYVDYLNILRKDT